MFLQKDEPGGEKAEYGHQTLYMGALILDNITYHSVICEIHTYHFVYHISYCNIDALFKNGYLNLCKVILDREHRHSHMPLFVLSPFFFFSTSSKYPNLLKKGHL